MDTTELRAAFMHTLGATAPDTPISTKGTVSLDTTIRTHDDPHHPHLRAYVTGPVTQDERTALLTSLHKRLNTSADLNIEYISATIDPARVHLHITPAAA